MFDHISLKVKSPAASRKFYARALAQQAREALTLRRPDEVLCQKA
jgi:catechol 2,3-dioxygenase-like lactoylglutathione lyase family enzyme